MANGGQIEFDVGFNVHSETLKNALKELKSIQSLESIDILGFEGTIAELNEAKRAAQNLEVAFENAFNQELGVLNISKFKQQIENTYGSINKARQALSSVGDIGTSAWRRIATEVITTNTYIKQSDKIIAKMAETLGNTLKWNIASGAINKMSGSIQEAWGFTKALDSSLNDIQIVTGKSADQMDKLADRANKVATSLGTTTKAYTDAALTFYQQGLGDEDVAARAETSLKVSNVTGLSGDQSAEYVTAVLNGYKVAAEDAEAAMDKLAAVGANTASSLAELSEGMAKVASSANAMGVSEDQLAATLSTVISVTRQDAASVGTAFKTIYARISDIKAGTADAEVSLGNYTKKMAEMGFNVLDATGNMRDLGEVVEEIGGKWKNLSREQQISLAQTMAGTRQYNNLIALFDNWAQYEDALNVSMEANGTLQKQQEVYADSLAAKLNELTAAKEKLFMSIVDEDGIKDIVDGFTTIIDKVATLIKALGGGKTLLLEIGVILTKVFNKQISESLMNLNKNIQGVKMNIQNNLAKISLMEDMKGQDIVVDKIMNDYKELSTIMDSMSEKEQNQIMNFLKQKAVLEEELELEKQRVEENRKIIELATEGATVKEGKKDFSNTEKAQNKIKAEKNINDLDNLNLTVEQLDNVENEYSEIVKLEEIINEKEAERNELLQKSEELTEEEKQKLVSVEKSIQDATTSIEKYKQSISQKGLSLFDIAKEKTQLGELFAEYTELKRAAASEEENGNEEANKKLLEQAKSVWGQITDLIRESYAEAEKGTSIGKIEGKQGKVDDANRDKDALLKAQDAQIAAQAMTQFATALGQVAMGWSQIKQLGSIWSDEDMSMSEKMIATMTALSMIIPAITTSISGLSAVKKAYIALLATENAELTKEQIKEYGAAAAKTAKAMASIKASLATAKETIAEKGLIKALTEKIALLIKEIALLIKKKVLEDSAKLATEVIAAAAIAATAFAIAKVTANREKEAKETKKAAEEERKHTEELREQKEAIDKLCSSQKDLSSQLEKGEISIEQYRQKLKDLCNEYGFTELAAKSLYMTESEMAKEYADLQNKINTQLIQQNERQASLDKKAAIAGIKQSAGSRTDGFGETLDLKGMGLRSDEEEAFQADLEALGVSFTATHKMYTDKFIDAFANNSEAVLDVLNKYDIQASEQILGYISENQELFDSLSTSVQEAETLKMNQNLEESYQQGIKNTQEYRAVIEEEAKKAADAANPNLHKGDEEWDEYYNKMIKKAEQYYSQYDDMVRMSTMSKISEKMEEAQWEINEGINLTQDQMEFLYLHLDTFEAFNSLDEFLAYFDNEIKLRNSQKGLDLINSFFSDEKRESLSSEEIGSLYSQNQDFESQSGYSMGEFQKIDWQDQKIAMIDYYQTAQMERYKYNEGIDATRAAMAKEFDEKLNLAKTDISEDVKNADGLNQMKALIDHSTELNKLSAERESIEALTTEDINKQVEAMNKVAADSAKDLGDLQELKSRDAFKDDINTANIDEGKAAYNQKAAELYQSARMEGLDSDELRDYAKYLQEASDNSEYLSDDLKDNLAACQDLAVQIKRMNKGVDTLSKNWKKWSDVLSKSSVDSEEYADAIIGSKKAMADLLDVTDEFISDDLITNNMEDIAKAAEGDADAIDRLRDAMLEDIVLHMDLDDDSLEGQALLDRVNEIQGMLDINSLEVGAEIDLNSLNSSEAAFIEALNQLILDTGMTVDQVNAMLSGMGFEANYASEPQDATSYQTVYTKQHIVENDTGPNADGPRTWTEREEIVNVEQVPLTAETMAMAMTTDGTVPKINSLTKKAGGAANNASSRNPGGGKGGKGGGGGGGGKAKDPDKMDKLDDQIDRYHDINIIIKNLTTEFERLGKAQDKLVGKDLIDNLNKQLQILDQQIQAYRHKLELERQEAAELRGDLGTKGVTFNDDGTIANYAEALQAQEDYVNSLIEQYNNMSAEEQEKFKETVEQAKKDYEKFKENIDRYDTVITDEIPGLEDQIQEAMDKQIEINIKKFNMAIDIRLELQQAEKDWNKFKRKIVDGMKDEDLFGKGLESFENLKDLFDLGDGKGVIDSLSSQVDRTRAEIEKMQNGEYSEIYGDNMTAALEDLNKYNSELMQQLEDMDDLIAEIEQGLLDTMDEIKDKMDAQVEAYEYINDLIDSDVELIKLLYGEDAYDSLGAYYSQKHDNYLKALDFDRKEVDFWEQQMNDAKASGNDEAYQKALENYRESVKRLNDDVKNSVQNIIDTYSNAINKAFDELDKKFTGGFGLDYMQEEWELINTNADRYLDTINSTYEVQKLQNKYKDAIKNTDSTSIQKKLNALMEEEIGMLEKKDKLSQYDIDRANMKYEIALKQIALEEAQKNKSSMRMKRDSQGNYSYVYAGDEEDISSKQQELADAQNQLYNLDKEQYQSNLNDMMSYYSEFTDKYKELMLDTTISDEERENRKKMLIEQYGQLINSIQMDNESIRLNLSESTFDSLSMLYETDATSFSVMTGLESADWSNMTSSMLNDIQNKMVPTWDSSIQSMIDKFKAEGGLEEACRETFKEIETAADDFKKKLEEVQSAAGLSFDEIARGEDTALEKAKELIGDNQQIIDESKQQIEQYKELIAQVTALADAYSKVRENAIKSAEAAHDLVNAIQSQAAATADLTNKWEQAKLSFNDYTSKVDSYNPTGTTPRSGGGGGGSSSGGGGGGGASSSPTGSGSAQPKKKKFYVYAGSTKVGGPYELRTQAENMITANRGKMNGQTLKIKEYKTGGYTGSWAGGSDVKGGRLAFLHQKELVLNEKDTENYLKAVQEMRKVQAELKDSSTSSIIGTMFKAIGDTISDKIRSYQDAANRVGGRNEFGFDLDSGIVQHIIINADFPDATQANEIQRAFDQLIGMAAQKANNKNR